MAVKTYKNFSVSHTQITNKRSFTGIHYHSDYELYYLVRGKTNYFITDEIFAVKPGNFVFVSKGVIHKTDSEDCTDNERILLAFDDSILTSEALKHIEELAEEKLIIIPPSQLYIFEDLLSKIEAEHASGSQELIDLYTLELLALLCRHKQKKAVLRDETDEIIHSVSRYINQNFGQDLSLKNLSRTFAVSESHLSRKFKAVTGMGLCEYITFVRVHNGARLLKETNLSLTEISSRCGFNDSNYFSSVFKKIKGTTPYKYSKRYKME